MTETPTETTTDQAAAPEPQDANCRHCGQPSDTPQLPGADWQCTACERYQDSMTCGTCGSVVRISLMPDSAAPEIHAPTRRRAVKE